MSAATTEIQITYCWVGQLKLIKVGERYYRNTELARNAALDHAWAKQKLALPNVKFANGRWSHEVACQLLDGAEYALIDYMVVIA